jgi:RNA polymerase sigma factor (sigma-70 family)
MMGASDQQLLREYVERRSEAAFTELVRRHVDMVFSAAVRMVCDGHLAQDVAQGVFVGLARNAARLTDRPVLSGWLHRTARNLAAETVRKDVRRRAREQEAAAMNDPLSARPDPLWENLAPHLDAVLDELSDSERDAVLLRYFERKTAREMAQTLGVSEEAAQKRVSRAVERLRALFASRGVSVGAGGLALLITANAVQAAPAGLAGGAAAAALAASGGGATTLTLLKLIAMTKLQTATVGAIVVAAAVLTPLVLRQQASLRRENDALRGQLAELQAANQSLSNQLAAPRPAPAPIFVSAPANAPAITSFQQVMDFLDTHNPELPAEQIEAYLRQNQRNAESLLAAFQVSHNLAYLREAATNAPGNSAVQFAVLANNLFPEDQRKWIDAFKASSPANAMPWYFSALDYFKSNQPDQAEAELAQATRRQIFSDYGPQSAQAVEEMYDSAGWPALAAKACAASDSSSSGPYVNLLKALAADVLQVQQQSANQGNTASAISMASMGMQLGDQLRQASGPIDELVGVGIEKKILAQLDPAQSYDFLDGSVTNVQAQLDQQKQTIRQVIATRDQFRPTLGQDELNDYWEREKMYGEMYALQWLQSKHGQQQ